MRRPTGSATSSTWGRSCRGSAWISPRPGPATRRAGSCRRWSTRPPGYDGDPKLRTAFPSERPAGVDGSRSQIVEGPIAFFALCEHHALPFHGVAHVAYVAGPEILGISKLTRLVRLYARRFTVQERLGEQIADALVELVAPRGVAVRLEAAHLCTQMRGVAEEGSRTVTTFWRGAYNEDADLRREFLDGVRGH